MYAEKTYPSPFVNEKKFFYDKFGERVFKVSSAFEYIFYVLNLS